MAQQDMQNLIQNWMEQQQKLWQEWVQRMQGATSGAGAMPPWSQGMDQWQQAVEHTLETQRQALHTWADQVASVEGAPEEVRRWASEGVQMIDQWTDAQRALWHHWFELAGSSTAAGGGAQLNPLMPDWQKMASEMQDLQRRWASAFSGMTDAPGSKRGGRPTGSAKK